MDLVRDLLMVFVHPSISIGSGNDSFSNFAGSLTSIPLREGFVFRLGVTRVIFGSDLAVDGVTFSLIREPALTRTNGIAGGLVDD